MNMNDKKEMIIIGDEINDEARRKMIDLFEKTLKEDKEKRKKLKNKRKIDYINHNMRSDCSFLNFFRNFR